MSYSIPVSKLIKAAMVDIENKTHEIPRGSNWSPRIAEMLANVGIDEPAYWCMAAVYTWFKEAGLAKYTYRSGLCQDVYNFGKRQGIVTKKPSVGDVGLIWSADFSHVHHTFIVTQVNADGTVSTIEGNTNDEGARDGYEVCERIREITNRLVFFHWQSLVIETEEEQSYILQIGNKAMKKLITAKDGSTFLNLRSYLLLLFDEATVTKKLGWDKVSSQPLWEGKNLPQDVEVRLQDGMSYVKTRPALAWMGLQVKSVTDNTIVAIRN